MRNEMEGSLSRNDIVVDDVSVLESFQESVRQGGEMREYLEAGVLAWLHHDILIVVSVV